MINRNLSMFKNRNASSKVVYNDSLTAIAYGHNPRTAPVTVETAQKANYERILQITVNALAMPATSKLYS